MTQFQSTVLSSYDLHIRTTLLYLVMKFKIVRYQASWDDGDGNSDADADKVVMLMLVMVVTLMMLAMVMMARTVFQILKRKKVQWKQFTLRW